MITIQRLYDKMTQSDTSKQCSYSIINVILKENLKSSDLSVSDFGRNFFISISINFFHLIFARNLLLL